MPEIRNGTHENRRYPKHIIGGWDWRIGQIGVTSVIDSQMFRGPKKHLVDHVPTKQNFVLICVRVFSKYYSLGKSSGKRQNVGHKSYSLFRFAD